MAAAAGRATIELPHPSEGNLLPRTISVDRLACTGCNVCVEICPEVFELDEDQVAVVQNQRGDTEEAIQEAIDACPESCLHWKD